MNHLPIWRSNFVSTLHTCGCIEIRAGWPGLDTAAAQQAYVRKEQPIWRFSFVSALLAWGCTEMREGVPGLDPAAAQQAYVRKEQPAWLRKSDILPAAAPATSSQQETSSLKLEPGLTTAASADSKPVTNHEVDCSPNAEGSCVLEGHQTRPVLQQRIISWPPRGGLALPEYTF